MAAKQWKSPTTATFMILATLGAMTLPIVTIATTPDQTPSVQAQCTDVEIQKHIQQLNKGEITDFDALVWCDSKAVPALIKALENEDENFRIITIAALGEIGSKATLAVPSLNKLLKDKRKNIRIITIFSLGKIIGKDAVGSLIQAFKDKNEDVRSSAAYALGKIGKDAVPALIIALKDPDSNIRAGAAYALGEIGTDAKDTIPYLTTALKDPDSKVRSAATNTLNKFEKDANIFEEVKKDDGVYRCSRLSNKRDEERCLQRIKVDHLSPSTQRMYTTVYLRNNPPFMCKLSIIKALLRWKCP